MTNTELPRRSKSNRYFVDNGLNHNSMVKALKILMDR